MSQDPRPEPVVFQVDSRRVEPSLNRISTTQGSETLEPKVMEVLVCLIQRAGQVVPRQDLIGEVWGDVYTSPDVVPRAISILRKAFEDDAADPRVIETVRKRGYRLIAEVVPLGESDRLEGTSVAPRTLRSGPSTPLILLLGTLAVLLIVLVALSSLERGDTRGGIPSIRPLSTFPGAESNPDVTPDGQQYAFVWGGPRGDNQDIYVGLVDSGTPYRLTHDPAPDVHPVWSPHADRVAFLRKFEKSEALLLVDVYGKQERKLLDLDFCGGFDWSPDGKTLAISERDSRAGRFRLSLVSVDGLERKSAGIEGIEGGSVFDPIFSPDGSELAFKYLAGGSPEIWVAPVSGGVPRRFRESSRSLAWGSEGRNLLFTSDRTGSMSLWSLPLSGGPVHPLDLDGEISELSVAQRSDLAVYIQRTRDLNIWRSRIDSSRGQVGESTRILASTRWEIHPRFSPQGNLVAFASNRSGSFELWVRDERSNSPMKLTDLKASFLGSPSWSPDGRTIAFQVRIGKSADIYLIEIGEVTPRRLTSEPSDELSPSWSRDGRGIYFASNRAGEWNIYKVPVSGGDPIQVTQQGGYGGVESLEGDALFYSKRGELWKKSFATGQETSLLSVPSGNWELVPGGIVFEEVGPKQRTSIVLFRFRDGQTVELLQPAHEIPEGGHALSVSPDGTWLLYGQIDHSEADLMLVSPLHALE